MMMPSRSRKRSVSTEPGLTDVDLHAVALAEIGQRLHEGDLRADHRGADHVVGDRRARADAADGDDRAAAAFSSGQAARQSRTCAKNFSAKPASQSASVCLKKSPRRDGAGVVDQDIEPAEALLGRASASACGALGRAGRRRGSRPCGRARGRPRRRRRARPDRARSAADRSRPRQARARWPCRCRGSRRSPARPCRESSPLIRHRLRIAGEPSTGETSLEWDDEQREHRDQRGRAIATGDDGAAAAAAP